MNATQDEKRFTIVDQVEVKDEWVDVVEQVRYMNLYPVVHPQPNLEGLLLRIKNDNVAHLHPLYSREPSLSLAEVTAMIAEGLRHRRGEYKPDRKKPDPDPAYIFAGACKAAMSLWWILRLTSLTLEHRMQSTAPWPTPILSLTLRFQHHTEVSVVRSERAIDAALFTREHIEKSLQLVEHWIHGAAMDLLHQVRTNKGMMPT